MVSNRARLITETNWGHLNQLVFHLSASVKVTLSHKSISQQTITVRAYQHTYTPPSGSTELAAVISQTSLL